MKKWGVILVIGSLSLSGCAATSPPSGGANLEDVCDAAGKICKVADVICLFVPKKAALKGGLEDSLSQRASLASLAKELDSLNLVIQQAIKEGVPK